RRVVAGAVIGYSDSATAEKALQPVRPQPAAEVAVVVPSLEAPPRVEAPVGVLVVPREKLVDRLLPCSGVEARARREDPLQLEHAASHARSETQQRRAGSRAV